MDHVLHFLYQIWHLLSKVKVRTEKKQKRTEISPKFIFVIELHRYPNFPIVRMMMYSTFGKTMSEHHKSSLLWISMYPKVEAHASSSGRI